MTSKSGMLIEEAVEAHFRSFAVEISATFPRNFHLDSLNDSIIFWN